MMTMSAASYISDAVSATGRTEITSPVPVDGWTVRIARWLKDRAVRRHLSDNLARLQETSPHLMADLGLAEEPVIRTRRPRVPAPTPPAIPLQRPVRIIRPAVPQTASPRAA